MSDRELLPIALETVRQGFEVSCWVFEGFAVVRARPPQAAGPSDRSLPALPSRSRLVLWGDGSGQIRARLIRPTRWARLVARVRRAPIPSPEQQLASLTDELLAAIELAPGANEWIERGGDAPVPRAPIMLPGHRPLDTKAPPEKPWGVVVAALGLALTVALLAAIAPWRAADPPSAPEPPFEPARIGESLGRDAFRVAPEPAMGGEDAAPMSTPAAAPGSIARGVLIG